MSTQEHTHGNKLWPHKPVEIPPDVRKVDVSTVPAVFNADVVGNGRTVWAAYADTGELIAVAATADEARKKWRTFMAHKREREHTAKREKGSSEKS